MLKKVLHLESAMEYPDGDKCDRVYWDALMVINKIVFTSPEAMVEFSGKNKTLALVKTPWTYANIKYIFIWKVNCETFSPSS